MSKTMRMLKYLWFRLVMTATCWLPDLEPVWRLRGFLAKPAFKKCGRNLQIASGVIIGFTSNIEIGNDVFIANYCWIGASGGLQIEDEVMLGPFVVIAAGDHVFKDGSARFAGCVRAPVKLGRGCWIAAHAVITAGITVGKGALVAANAVVTHDVRDTTVNAGVPAREISSHIKYVPPDPSSIRGSRWRKKQ